MVTVRGSPFVDTGPKIICRWTPEDGGEPILSVRTTFIDSSNIICETPAVFTRMRTRSLASASRVVGCECEVGVADAPGRGGQARAVPDRGPHLDR